MKLVLSITFGPNQNGEMGVWFGVEGFEAIDDPATNEHERKAAGKIMIAINKGIMGEEEYHKYVNRCQAERELPGKEKP